MPPQRCWKRGADANAKATLELHTYGLLVQAFRPPEEVCVLRSYLRQREMLVQAAAERIQHMQKALQQMNLLMHNVVSDITGVTGMDILKAIIAGQRDTQVLAALRDRRCHNSIETIAKSLVGNYREEHLFALRQAVELYETYQVRSTTAKPPSPPIYCGWSITLTMSHQHRKSQFPRVIACAPASKSATSFTK